MNSVRSPRGAFTCAHQTRQSLNFFSASSRSLRGEPGGHDAYAAVAAKRARAATWLVMGWSPCARLNSHWASRKSLATWRGSLPWSHMVSA